MVAAHLDLDGIPERGEADQFHRRADQQAHFHEARAAFRRHADVGHRGASAKRQGGQGLWGNRHGSGPGFAAGKRLNENGFRQPLAQAEPGVADLADQGPLLSQKLDLLLFTEAHLPQPQRQLRRSQDLLDPADGAGRHLGQRADKRLVRPAVYRLW